MKELENILAKKIVTYNDLETLRQHQDEFDAILFDKNIHPTCVRIFLTDTNKNRNERKQLIPEWHMMMTIKWWVPQKDMKIIIKKQLAKEDIPGWTLMYAKHRFEGARKDLLWIR